MTTDYKSSVFLPKTDFPMRAGLPKKEPELLKRWADMNLFHRLRSDRLFIDGCCHLGVLGHKVMGWVTYNELRALGWFER